jgi:hypothetical protein
MRVLCDDCMQDENRETHADALDRAAGDQLWWDAGGKKY